MSRGANLFTVFSISSIVWVILIFISEGYVNEIAKSLPTYGLIIYFSYALFKVGSDLAQLKDYPEEAEKLKKEIEESKKYYQSKGIQL